MEHVINGLDALPDRFRSADFGHLGGRFRDHGQAGFPASPGQALPQESHEPVGLEYWIGYSDLRF
jgi:hypothetical protein